MSVVAGYPSFKDAVGKVRGIADFSPIGRGGHPQVRHMPVEMISQSFHPDVSQHLDFRASEWPGNVEEFRAADLLRRRH
jgi:hypothetical protein